MATPVVVALGDKSADRTTVSTTFVDFTDLSATIAASVGDKLYLVMSIQSITNTPYTGMTFNVGVGGGAPTGDVLGTDALDIISGGNDSRPASINWVHTVVAGDITGGNVTVKGRWFTSSGTSTARNSTLGRPRLIVVNFTTATTVVMAYGDKSANRTTASGAFVDFTDLTATIAAATGDKLYMVMSLSNGSAANNMGMTFNVPTGDVAGTDSIDISATNNDTRPVCIHWLYTVQAGDISAGNVVVKGRWNSSSGTMTATNSVLARPRLIVVNYKH